MRVRQAWRAAPWLALSTDSESESGSDTEYDGARVSPWNGVRSITPGFSPSPGDPFFVFRILKLEHACGGRSYERSTSPLQSTFMPWEELCEEAGQFASEIGREKVINISVAYSHQTGVIVVWYWD